MRITKLGGQRYALWGKNGEYLASGSYGFVKKERDEGGEKNE